MKQEDILTEKQKIKRIETAVEGLKQLLEILKKEKLLKAIEIGNYRTEGSSYSYGTLKLTNEGLLEECGYHDCSFGESFYSDSYRCSPQVVEESNFESIILKYKLTLENLTEIMKKITR